MEIEKDIKRQVEKITKPLIEEGKAWVGKKSYHASTQPGLKGALARKIAEALSKK